MVEREPITVVVSEKGWIRALKGHVVDTAALQFKSDDALKFAFHAETTDKILRRLDRRPLLHARRATSCRAAAATASRSG